MSVAHWYILQSLSGHEKKIADAIREKADKEGLSEHIKDIVVPVEKIEKIQKGKKIDIEKKFLPGYILIKMVMNDNLWHAIQKIPKVGGFLGDQGKPQKVSEEEVHRITKQIESKAVERQQAMRFEVGDSVTVNDGPFESFTGIVEVVDDVKQRLKVSVTIFGRATPVDLNFDQVKKEN